MIPTLKAECHDSYIEDGHCSEENIDEAEQFRSSVGMEREEAPGLFNSALKQQRIDLQEQSQCQWINKAPKTSLLSPSFLSINKLLLS